MKIFLLKYKCPNGKNKKAGVNPKANLIIAFQIARTVCWLFAAFRRLSSNSKGQLYELAQTRKNRDPDYQATYTRVKQNTSR